MCAYVSALELVRGIARDGLGKAIDTLGVVESGPSAGVEKTGCFFGFPMSLGLVSGGREVEAGLDTYNLF